MSNPVLGDRGLLRRRDHIESLADLTLGVKGNR